MLKRLKLILYTHNNVFIVENAKIIMTDLQSQLLELLKRFDFFCQKNEIEYCLMWGTLLGCIREKGFIPWDDDIDIAMDRTNFEKLKVCAREGKLPANISFEDSLFLKGCRVPKIRNKEISIRDRNGGEGIFIDVFPFDRFTTLDMRVLLVASWGLRLRDYRRKINNRLLRSIYTPVSVIPYLCFVFVRKIYSLKRLGTGVWVGKAPIANPEVFFDIKDYYPFVRKKFETLALPVPNGYDKILKKVYGNYMIPKNYNNVHY